MENYKRYFYGISRTAQRYYNSHMTEELTAQEAHALRVTSIHQTLNQQLLADRLGIDKSQVTRLVNRLEERGYITRETDPRDRRAKLITSTPKADAVKAMDVELTNRYYEWLLSELEGAEKEQFTQTLIKLYERARESRKNGFAELEEKE